MSTQIPAKYATPFPNLFNGDVHGITVYLARQMKLSGCDPDGLVDVNGVPGKEFCSAALRHLQSFHEDDDFIPNLGMRAALAMAGMLSTEEIYKAESDGAWVIAAVIESLDRIGIQRLLTWAREVNPDAFKDAPSVERLIASVMPPAEIDFAGGEMR